MLCECRLYAKRFTEVISVNPLEVVPLSYFGEETSLERLSDFAKVLHLEMTEPEMDPNPPSPEFFPLTLERLPQGGRRGRTALPCRAKSSSKEPFQFPM